MALLLAVFVALAAVDGGGARSPGGAHAGERDEDRLARMARQDLAKRLGIDEKEVKTRSVRPRTWPDASLGCPKPDTMYAQVETPGFLIELEARGKRHEYHADTRRVVSCE